MPPGDVQQALLHRFSAQAHFPAEFTAVTARIARSHHAGPEALTHIAPGEDLEFRPQGGVASAAARRRAIEYDAASQGSPVAGGLRKSADDETITGKQRERCAIDVQARKSSPIGRGIGVSDRSQARATLGGADEQFHRRDFVIAPRPLEPMQFDVGAQAGGQAPGPGEDIAPMQLGDLQPLEIDRATRTRGDAIHLLAVTLEPTDSAAEPGGMHFDGLSLFQRPAHQGAGGDGSEAPHGKDAVDPEPGRAISRCSRTGIPRRPRDRFAQGFEPFPGLRRDRNDGGPRQPGRFEQLRDFLAGEFDQFLVGQIRLGEGHHPAFEAEQIADGDVFTRLGHHALVGGNHQEQQVDARGAGHHRAHQSLVARYVHHRESSRVGQIEGRETQVDGDSPTLLLGQSVGIGSGQRPDQGRLAVIDMPRRSQHQAPGAVPGSGGGIYACPAALAHAGPAPFNGGRCYRIPYRG